MRANKLIAPGVCAICEMSNDVEYFDTLFNMHTEPAVTRLEGRKYLCHNCFMNAAEFFGYHAGNQIETAEAAVELARKELIALKDWHDHALDRIASSDRKLGEAVKRPAGRPKKVENEE